MADEGFFSRWSRRKAQAGQGGQEAPAKPAEASLPEQADAWRAADTQPAAPAAAAQPAAPVGDQAKPQLTMEDVARLTPESDYSPFLARGVDESVKRSAMKKLFSDPHFNVMDGLDIYIDDYNKFEPISPQMLASLNHAKALLDPLSQLEKPLLPLADSAAETEEQASAEDDRQEAGDAQAESVQAADDIAPDAESGAPQTSDIANPEQDGASENTADPTQFSKARS